MGGRALHHLLPWWCILLWTTFTRMKIPGWTWSYLVNHQILFCDTSFRGAAMSYTQQKQKGIHSIRSQFTWQEFKHLIRHPTGQRSQQEAESDLVSSWLVSSSVQVLPTSCNESYTPPEIKNRSICYHLHNHSERGRCPSGLQLHLSSLSYNQSMIRNPSPTNGTWVRLKSILGVRRTNLQVVSPPFS